MKIEIDDNDLVLPAVVLIVLIICVVGFQGCKVDRDYMFRCQQLTNATERMPR